MANKTCTPFNHPNMVDGWGCCKCSEAGSGTFNGNNRSHCKICNHQRCDSATVKRIPIKEDNGVRIVVVKVGSKNEAN